jgi:hypothetical protein
MRQEVPVVQTCVLKTLVDKSEVHLTSSYRECV